MITETFLDASILNSEVFPDGYAVFRHDRSRHGGGVLIAVSHSFSAIYWSTSESSNIELIWIQISIGTKSFMLGGFYRPPGSPESYLLELQSSIVSLSTNSPIFICGDLNVPDISWTTVSPTSSDKNAALLCSLIHDLSLEQLIHSPTRGSNILDLLLINSPSIISGVEVVDNLPLTDHDAILFTLNVLSSKQTTVRRSLYNYKKADFNAYRETLATVPWDITESDDIETWWSQWKALFFAAVDDVIPQVKWKRRKMKSWLSPSTIKLVRLKRLKNEI